MKMLTLSIVIPVYNEKDHIIACLESIADQTVLPDEVIIVDNNCTDETISLASSYPFVRIVKETKPGIAPARSAGFNAARTDLIGRIDADTILPVNWVEDAKNYLVDHPDELLTGGCYLYDLGFPRFSGLVTEYFSFRVNRIILGNYIAWGSNSVFRRELWLNVRHLMNEDNSIHEDIDFGIQLINQGYKIIYDRDRIVGIDSKIFSESRGTREQHFEYLRRWPNTLKAHNLKRAWIGTLGMYVVYNIYYPLLITHNVGKLFAKLFTAPERQG